MKDDFKGSVTLWKKQSGNAMSHIGGLTAAQIAEMNLQPGDRLVVLPNKNKRGSTDFDLRITVLKAEANLINGQPPRKPEDI